MAFDGDGSQLIDFREFLRDKDCMLNRRECWKVLLGYRTVGFCETTSLKMVEQQRREREILRVW